THAVVTELTRIKLRIGAASGPSGSDVQPTRGRPRLGLGGATSRPVLPCRSWSRSLLKSAAMRRRAGSGVGPDRVSAFFCPFLPRISSRCPRAAVTKYGPSHWRCVSYFTLDTDLSIQDWRQWDFKATEVTMNRGRGFVKDSASEATDHLVGP